MRILRFIRCAFSIATLFLVVNLPSLGQSINPQVKFPVSIKSFTPENQRISPMPLQERINRGIIPSRGLVSIVPGVGENDMLMSGNGKLFVSIYGNPTNDLVTFRHENIQLPWKLNLEAPKIANVLPEVRRLMLEGKFSEGLQLSVDAAAQAGAPGGIMNHEHLNAFLMKINQPANGALKNYIRTLDFESGEVKVLWEDNQGTWERSCFVSRPDNVVVQLLTAAKDKRINTKIELVTGNSISLPQQASEKLNQALEQPKEQIEQNFNGKRLIVIGRFVEPNTGNKGFAGVVRVVLNGGSATVENGILVVKDAKSVMLLTRIEWYTDFKQSKVNELVNALDKITPDYKVLLSRNRKVQADVIDRASLNFNTNKEEQAMSSEEILADQKTRIGYNFNLLEKLFDMGRYWVYLESGDFPPIYGHINVNVNLQVAGVNMGNIPESMNSFSNWIEGMLPDARINAKNIFGARGALYATHPDHETGVLYHFDFGWPHHYWISAGGWVYSPIWDRYLVSGDKEYLKNHVMPGLRELGLFYEDYLKEKDERNNFIFVPSYSPENWPGNINEGKNAGGLKNPPAVINATMDIMVCREVLMHLIEGAEILGTDTDKIPVWKALLDKMPPYVLDTDGALKEWSWPTLDEFQDHRHISHMYGVWPSDEIDPDRTPELARASWLANNKRAQGNGSGHGISHRMLAAARLKDNNLVNAELKQFLEQGYIGSVLSASHNPYTRFFGDQQGSILTVLMEMLVYSREGVVEILPALPETLDHGTIKGILSRSFAKIDELTWNMKDKTADITINSLKTQDITLIVRYGIESIKAPEGVLKVQPKTDEKTCILHLQQNEPVKIQIKLGQHKPSDWILNIN